MNTDKPCQALTEDRVSTERSGKCKMRLGSEELALEEANKELDSY